MSEIDITAPFEERAEAMLARVFGGMHHVMELKKRPGNSPMWTCSQLGDIATFDFSLMTRLVFAAHDYCLRISVLNGGPRILKIMIHNRHGREGDATTRHPTIEQALEKWRAKP